MTKFNIKESFSWMAAPDFQIINTGKNTVTIKGIAVKKNQISRNKRKYVEEELIKGARTFIGAPVTINHSPYDKSHPMYDGRKVPGNVRWMEYEDGNMEYMADIKKQPYVDLIRNKSVEIRGVSIEADYLFNRCSHCGKDFYSVEEFKDHMVNEHFIHNFNYEPRGIVGRALSLVISPEEPGIIDTTIELAETAPTKGFSRLLETVIKTKKENEDMNKKLGDKAVITPISRITPDRAKQLKEQEEEQVKKDAAATDPTGEQNPPTHPVLPHVPTEEPKEDKAETEPEHPVPDLPPPPETKVMEQEPETDEHGCVIGKERWDGNACVPIVTEQEEPEEEKDEHGCIIGKERWNGESCVPLATEQIECPEGYHPNEAGDACVADVEETAEETPSSQLPPVQPVLPHVPTEEPEEDKADTLPTDQTAPATTGPPPREDKADEIPEAPVTTLPAPPEVKVTEIKLPLKLRLGEPFGGYTNFEDCVSKNQDKEDPAAYCASIKQKVEKETLQETIGTYEPYVRDVQIASAVNQLTEAVASLSLTNPKQLKQVLEFANKSVTTINTANSKNLNEVVKAIKANNSANTKHFAVLETLIQTNSKTQTQDTSKKLKEITDNNETQTQQAAKKLKEVTDSLAAFQANKKPFEILATDIAKRSKDTNNTIAQVAETAKKLLTEYKTKTDDAIKILPHVIKQMNELKGIKETFEKLLAEADKNAEARDEKIKSLEERLAESEKNKVKETADQLKEINVKIDNLEDKLKPQFKAHSERVTETEETKDKPHIPDPITDKGRK